MPCMRKLDPTNVVYPRVTFGGIFPGKNKITFAWFVDQLTFGRIEVQHKTGKATLISMYRNPERDEVEGEFENAVDAMAYATLRGLHTMSCSCEVCVRHREVMNDHFYQNIIPVGES